MPALVIILVAICLFIKCRKPSRRPEPGDTGGAAAVGRARQEPAPGHWRPARVTQTPVSLSLDITIPPPQIPFL